MKTTLKQLVASGSAALMLSAGIISFTAAPVAAQACKWGHCGHPGHGPGHVGHGAPGYAYGGHHHHGWGGPAAVGILGGLALGAIAAGAAGAYDAPPPPDGCIQPQPVYDQWGNYMGTRPVRVC